MFVPPRLPDSEANCSLRKYDILMGDPFTDALHLAYPGVGIEVGCGEKLVAGLFDCVFRPSHARDARGVTTGRPFF